ncbi:transcriptional regulator, DeoR family [Treponema primitia ZAS-2]|uniref:Transcriptional regulator, DeoR family n=1 Tax=Treponema primitia (strain ATCC BAA-887 / DSM 12427 / ZAS-2) TaxID=545694 RepID=F5YMI8_TREPZ|nr:DeoR/GlpR family DNA-binding transcription regulator [Treponema primitia]AEF84568.1 transcriptional regulator, DeoR family [Treponema primitia ZAS-2]
MNERHNRILETLSQNHRVEVTVLANLLDVSQVTVRKDLDMLEERGLIRREHGFALFGSFDDVGRRMAFHYDTKRRIAKAAAELVEDEETVMIESGSCCALLAEELANTKRDVTIVTNSAYLANHIRHSPYGRVILLGGEYQKNSQVMVGPMTRKYAELFISDKYFIGADGFTKKFGFTGRDHYRAQAARDMAEQAKEIIVLTESEKFFRQGVEGIVRTEDITAVYTDDKIPQDIDAFLTERKVLVNKVSAVTQPTAALERVSS